MTKRISKSKLEDAEFVRAIDKFTKFDNCLLCGKKMTSACNSHVVPQFILKEIAEDGHVSYGHELHTFKVPGIKKTTGVRDAYTFRLICRECDSKYFKHYENPENLLNFDNLGENDKKLMLCEMALKAHLSHFSMKYKQLVMIDMVNQGKIAELEKQGKYTSQRLDLEEYSYYIYKLKKSIKSNKNPFCILYNKVLDYPTKLATQTIINFNYDLEGNQIFDPNLIEFNNHCRYFYLMVLPYKGKTRVLFYIEKLFINNVLGLVNQFNKLSDKEKLHFLFIALIIHDQQFYMNPDFAKNVLKKDRKLVNLYTNTDLSTSYQSKIKDFRKYKNYLLDIL